MKHRSGSRGGRGKDFEKEIELSFPVYSDRNVACLDFMPVPTIIIKKGNGVVAIPKRKAPFDVYGFWCADGTFVGAELKASQRKERLPIVGPNKKGDGLQFHQLDALYNLAKHNGMARLLWCNGGQIGVIGSNKLMYYYLTFVQAMKSEISGRASSGDKSIPWESFTEVKLEQWNGQPYYDWLR